MSLFSIDSSDNPVAQKLLIAQLQRYQINVVATSNGEEAIAGKLNHCLCGDLKLNRQ